MEQEFFNNLIKKETAKIDFKQEFYKLDKSWSESGKEWDEFFKDIIALTNGNIGTTGESAYLIFGITNDLKRKGIDLNSMPYNYNVSESKKQFYDKIEKVVDPLIQKISFNYYRFDGLDYLVISIPTSPYIHKLKKEIITKVKEREITRLPKEVVLLRRTDGEETYVASDEEKNALKKEKDLFFNNKKDYVIPTKKELNEKINIAFRQLKSKNSGEQLLSIHEIKEIICENYKVNELKITLCNYIRDKAQSKLTMSQLSEKSSQKKELETLWASKKSISYKKNIQECLNILLNHGDYTSTEYEGINLSGLFLPQYDFSNITCRGMKFSQSYLENCKFENSNFIDCEFKESILKGIHCIDNTEFIRCNFERANFSYSHLSNCNFTKSNFSHCCAKDAHFEDSNFEQCNFSKSHFHNSYFSDSKMINAIFIGAVFRYCDFSNIELTEEEFLFVESIYKTVMDKKYIALFESKFPDKLENGKFLQS